MAAKSPEDSEPDGSCSKKPRLDPMTAQPPAALPSRAELIEEYDIITEEDIEEIKDALEGGRIADAASKIMENLQAMENARLDIAVTGESGSGKSSFVNAIRGLDDEDVGAAATGVVETTLKPTPFPHPKYPNVTVWDLPGIGTPNFRSDTYLEQVGFSHYDFFIVIASERFKSNHARLAQEIQKMGKRFYFVRSKVDADLEATKKRRPHTYDEEGILRHIRENCQACLEAENVASPRIFLLSNWELSKYDFVQLEETLERELPSHKRHAFLLALPNISLEILRKKREAMQKQIWKLATVSCGVAAVPIPGLSVACDVTILIKSLSEYRKNFGLDNDSLEKLAEKVGKPVEEIKAVIKSPLAKEISKDVVLKMLTKAGSGALMAVEYFVSTVPILGSLAAGCISFGTTYYMLWSSLNEVADDAHNVLIKAFESDI
ncbi:interferon-inducible GTPase 5-like isoform X2 [Paroedura picta]|uniref:interferon-inducible GTPase 5-like isoform X2 n=1 Tax=Paroedura picta TaxID=143630 RepID=UPI004057ADF3